MDLSDAVLPRNCVACCIGRLAPTLTVPPNSALVTDACAVALLRRASFSAAQRER
jgi:hypothetical protein